MKDKLRFVWEELKGLRERYRTAQTMRSELLFLAAEIPPISEAQIHQKASLLRSMLGPDYEHRLKAEGRYTELFFLKYCDAKYSDGSPHTAKKSSEYYLRIAIGCEPRTTDLQKFLYQIFQKDFREQYASQISAFRERYGKVELLVLHVSCVARLGLALESVASFPDSRRGIGNLVIVGRPAKDHAGYLYDAKEGILTVPADDTYEGLSQKMAAAFAFLALAGNKACVLKIDDDIRCCEPDRLLEDTVPLVRSRDYVGRVWHTKTGGLARSYHLDKCDDPDLAAAPYGLLADAAFANGDAYFVSDRAVNVLGKSAIYLRRLFEVENSYEDLAVGKILNYYGLYPSNLDPLELGWLRSIDKNSRPRCHKESGRIAARCHVKVP